MGITFISCRLILIDSIIRRKGYEIVAVGSPARIQGPLSLFSFLCSIPFLRRKAFIALTRFLRGTIFLPVRFLAVLLLNAFYSHFGKTALHTQDALVRSRIAFTNAYLSSR